MKIDEIGDVRTRGGYRNQRVKLDQEVPPDQVHLDLGRTSRSQKPLGKKTTDTNQTI